MTFDKHLTNDEVIETLKQIAGVEEAEEDVEDGKYCVLLCISLKVVVL